METTINNAQWRQLFLIHKSSEVSSRTTLSFSLSLAGSKSSLRLMTEKLLTTIALLFIIFYPILVSSRYQPTVHQKKAKHQQPVKVCSPGFSTEVAHLCEFALPKAWLRILFFFQTEVVSDKHQPGVTERVPSLSGIVHFLWWPLPCPPGDGYSSCSLQHLLRKLIFNLNFYPTTWVCAVGVCVCITKAVAGIILS